MTKEQERAIEYFKKHIKYFEEQIKFIEATDCDYYDEELELYQNRVRQFNIVLSMLEEKDKKIEKLEEIKDEAIRTCFYEYNNDTEILCRKLAKSGYIEVKERKIYKSIQRWRLRKELLNK